jgi:acetoin utilization deacetylase AcuC-like enzyme
MSFSMNVFWHDDVLGHDTGSGVFEAPPSDILAQQMLHPESAPRLINMRAALQRGPVSGALAWHEGRHATEEELLRFHTREYINAIFDANGSGRRFSSTTLMSPGSLSGLLAAAGTSVAAVEHVLHSGVPAMALVRPPGHHAAPAMADGYCFFNNVAVAAQAARAAGVQRIAIIDWDVHHGNGTQEGFYDDPDVFTISLHMDHGAWGGTHPQTGGVEERGRGAGMGTNLNLPLPMGSGDSVYEQAFIRFVEPALRHFRPELIVIANGVDASQFDPNGRQLLTMQGFNTLALRARALADELAGGKLLAVQEGGYNPAYSAYCVHAAAEGFIGRASSLADPLAYMPEGRQERIEADLAALARSLETVGGLYA